MLIEILETFSKSTRGCSSAGRAPALQAGGQEFDSPHLHQVEIRETAEKPLVANGLIAQPVRAHA